MKATLAQIRAGLATALATVPDCQTSAYRLDNPSPPTLQVMGFGELPYDAAMAHGLDDFTMIIEAFTGSPLDQPAQALLDEWVTPGGTNSVKAAIEADKKLGGIIDDLHVMRASESQIFHLPNRSEAVGCHFFVRILNSS